MKPTPKPTEAIAMHSDTPQILQRKPGEPGGEKATAKKLVSKLREAGLDNIKIQEAADERFIPTAYDSMRQAFNTRMDDLEAGVAGALAACALEEAKWWIERWNGGHGLCPEEVNCSECKLATDRIAVLERAEKGTVR